MKSLCFFNISHEELLLTEQEGAKYLNFEGIINYPQPFQYFTIEEIISYILHHSSKQNRSLFLFSFIQEHFNLSYSKLTNSSIIASLS